MKRFLLFAAICFMPSILLAQPITREQAQAKAESYLSKQSGSNKLKAVTSGKKLAPSRKGGTTKYSPYYVFNRGEQEGYVIVAGDDKIDGVMGYTDNGEFDYSAIPDNMRSWLDDYSEYVEAIQSGKAEAPKKIATHPAIATMMTTKWNQSWPYNNNCPLHNGSRSVTGCVATAFAQVLYYQHDKSVTETQADIPGYTTWTEKLAVPGIPKGSTIDWKNMQNSYSSSSSGIQQTAVANLMLYCGVAVEMDYTNSSSGAQTYLCADGMNKYFGYSTARYVYKSSYTDEGWDELMYKELNEGRVILLSGYNSSAGHAFVCDGYDGNRCYHINWGWGGSSDGYFLLNSLNPSSQGIGGSGDGYSEGLGAVIGALPDNYDQLEMPIANATVKKLCVANFDANSDGVFTYGEAAAVTDLGDVFKNQKFAAFTELYYFTALKNISDHAFDGNTLLTTLTLPKHIESIGEYAFSGCIKLKTLKFYNDIKSIGKGAFNNCKVLPDIELPEGLTAISDSTFTGCASFTAIDLPVQVEYIGSHAFDGCNKLTTFTVNNIEPHKIQLGTDVFANIDLSAATLHVVQGTEEYFTNTDQWKDFGNFLQERNITGGKFCEIQVDKLLYLYNVGTGKYLSKGEAWGTQATVSNEPLRFTLKHTASMANGVYYLTCEDSGKDGNIVFRTSSDNNVGNGVKVAFVDGGDNHITDKTAYWKIAPVSDGIYTIQVPSGQSGYTVNKYWGVQTDHKSDAASPTYGVYYDVDYDSYTRNCQWRFVEYDEQATELYNEGRTLANLIAIAENRKVDATIEQAVYDDINSTKEEVLHAQKTLRKKLGFIHFRDNAVRNAALANWDVDGNGEITTSEASKVENLSYTFYNSDVKTLADLEYFTGVTTFYGNSFQGCAQLEDIYVPSGLTTIYYWAFRYCSNLTKIDLPKVTTIGERVFGDCKSLKTVSIATPDPSKIDMGEAVFENVDVRNATLIVPKGSKELYAAANQWKEFGTIQEMRAEAQPSFSAIEPDVAGYICNVGEAKFINKGEAWGTQAIVSTTGLVYQFKRTKAMPEGQYYLYSDGTGKEGKVLFRTDTDKKVGEGVKACYVDGSAGETAYWTLNQSDDNLFTLAVPSSGDLAGVNPSHESSTYPTYGIYWDFAPSDTTNNVKWGFIRKEDKQAADELNTAVKRLRNLLVAADELKIDAGEEQAVYDNDNSTLEQVEGAIETLKVKLGYIQFGDSRTKSICTNNWDDDDDRELSLSEATAVSDIGHQFKGISAIKTFEELRHFTSLTEIKPEAFRNCSSLSDIYIPENVTKIGEKAFSGCTALKYIALLGKQKVDGQGCGVSKSVTLFVPEELLEAYQSDETWGICHIAVFTGIPVVEVDSLERNYGSSKSDFTYSVSGAPINGEPELINNTDATTPVGEYVIECAPGSITSPGLICKNGVLTVKPAILTVTGKSYTREFGEENPEFGATYRGWKNKEKVSILTSPVVFECDATKDSPAGDYEIRMSGAEAPNYEFVYVNGTLTITGGTTPGDVNGDSKVNITDVVDIINAIAKGDTSATYDIDGNGKINISDVVKVINIIAGVATEQP